MGLGHFIVSWTGIPHRYSEYWLNLLSVPNTCLSLSGGTSLLQAHTHPTHPHTHTCTSLYLNPLCGVNKLPSGQGDSCLSIRSVNNAHLGLFILNASILDRVVIPSNALLLLFCLTGLRRGCSQAVVIGEMGSKDAPFPARTKHHTL